MLNKVLKQGRKNQENLGRKGEDLAARFLEKNGFRILVRNYRSRYGEIDIIVEKDKTLFFVEVKSRHSFSGIDPTELIPYRKQRHISLMAQHYYSRYEVRDRSGVFAMVIVDFGKAVPTCEFIPHIFELNWGY